MKVDIKEQKENTLLSRNEIRASVNFEKSVTPSNKDIAQKIADLTKSEVSLVKVKKIDCQFGQNSGTIEADVYTSKEAMENIERKSRKQRKLDKEEAAKAKEEAAQKAKEEAEAAKAAAEAPAEEPKAEETNE